jgi:hypothetical protein
MLEGKVVNGYWEPGRLNRILGRQLECGQEPWYVRSSREIGEFASLGFRYFILGKKYDVELIASSRFSLYSHSLTKRQARNFQKTIDQSYSGFNDIGEYADTSVSIVKEKFGWR